MAHLDAGDLADDAVRARIDEVHVVAGTVGLDDPHLARRLRRGAAQRGAAHPGGERLPFRVVLDVQFAAVVMRVTAGVLRQRPQQATDVGLSRDDARPHQFEVLACVVVAPGRGARRERLQPHRRAEDVDETHRAFPARLVVKMRLHPRLELLEVEGRSGRGLGRGRRGTRKQRHEHETQTGHRRAPFIHIAQSGFTLRCDRAGGGRRARAPRTGWMLTLLPLAQRFATASQLADGLSGRMGKVCSRQIRIYKATAQTLVVSHNPHGFPAPEPGHGRCTFRSHVWTERHVVLEMLSASDVPFSSKEQEESSWLGVTFIVTALMIAFGRRIQQHGDGADRYPRRTSSPSAAGGDASVAPDCTIWPGLADTPSRNVVEVWDREEKNMIGHWLFVQAERPEVSHDTVVMFRETAAGQTPAIHYWYYPGERSGKEFVYPKDQAVKIAARTHENVLSTEGDVSPQSQVSSIDETGKVTPWKPERAPAPVPESSSDRNSIEGSGIAAQQARAPEPAPAPRADAFPQGGAGRQCRVGARAAGNATRGAAADGEPARAHEPVGLLAGRRRGSALR